MCQAKAVVTVGPVPLIASRSHPKVLCQVQRAHPDGRAHASRLADPAAVVQPDHGSSAAPGAHAGLAWPLPVPDAGLHSSSSSAARTRSRSRARASSSVRRSCASLRSRLAARSWSSVHSTSTERRPRRTRPKWTARLGLDRRRRGPGLAGCQGARSGSRGNEPRRGAFSRPDRCRPPLPAAPSDRAAGQRGARRPTGRQALRGSHASRTTVGQPFKPRKDSNGKPVRHTTRASRCSRSAWSKARPVDAPPCLSLLSLASSFSPSRSLPSRIDAVGDCSVAFFAPVFRSVYVPGGVPSPRASQQGDALCVGLGPGVLLLEVGDEVLEELGLVVAAAVKLRVSSAASQLG